MSLTLVIDQSVEAFLSEAGELLYENEAVNSLMLGLVEGALTTPPQPFPLLARVVENSKTVTAAVALYKEPANVIVTFASDQQLFFLAKALVDNGLEFSGVVGPRRESELFAAIWSKFTGKTYELAMGQKIYKIDTVTFPQNMRGTLKVATSVEFDFVFNWIKAFTKECLPSDRRTEEQWKEFTEKVIQRGGAHLWMIDVTPVAMALVSRPTKNGVSVSGVYTPPIYRKKGYASAMVASMSQKMLHNGKQFCVLYTDLANPTSNKIYQEVGYREVCESKHFSFT